MSNDGDQNDAPTGDPGDPELYLKYVAEEVKENVAPISLQDISFSRMKDHHPGDPELAPKFDPDLARDNVAAPPPLEDISFARIKDQAHDDQSAPQIAYDTSAKKVELDPDVSASLAPPVESVSLNYLKIKMDDVVVSAPDRPTDGSDIGAPESLSLNFAKIDVPYDSIAQEEPTGIVISGETAEPDGGTLPASNTYQGTTDVREGTVIVSSTSTSGGGGGETPSAADAGDPSPSGRGRLIKTGVGVLLLTVAVVILVSWQAGNDPPAPVKPVGNEVGTTPSPATGLTSGPKTTPTGAPTKAVVPSSAPTRTGTPKTATPSSLPTTKVVPSTSAAPSESPKPSPSPTQPTETPATEQPTKPAP